MRCLLSKSLNEIDYKIGELGISESIKRLRTVNGTANDFGRTFPAEFEQSTAVKSN